jgi:hypothetical protein
MIPQLVSISNLKINFMGRRGNFPFSLIFFGEKGDIYYGKF